MTSVEIAMGVWMFATLGGSIGYCMGHAARLRGIAAHPTAKDQPAKRNRHFL